MIKTSVVSAVTFDGLRVKLVVSRGSRCAMLVCLDRGITIGTFARTSKGLDWSASSDLVAVDNPGTGIWSVVSKMI